MKTLRKEEGQSLVLTALVMGILLAFMALAIDVSLLFRAKRNLQNAADSAATAAELDYYYYQSASSARTAGCAAANANGVSGTCTTGSCTGGSDTQICINVPPVDGPITSGAFAEAIVMQPNPTTLLAMFGFPNVMVGARAVAGAPGFSDACVYLMDKQMDKALDLKGNGKLSATNCAVYVNSDSTDAVEGNGHTTVNADRLLVAGNDPGANDLDPGRTRWNAPPMTPPISLDLPPIPPTGCTSTVTATEIYPAGSPPKKLSSSQASDSSISGSATNNVVCFTGSSAVQLDDGVYLKGAAGDGVLYVFESGVSLAGAAQFGYADRTPVGCVIGCTFKNTQGAVIDLAGGSKPLDQNNGALTVYAPTSGTYNSIGLMQPKKTWDGKSNTGGNHCPASPVDPCLLIQRGDSGSIFDGIVYAPGMYVELQDHAGSVYATGLIADGLFVKASDLIIDSYNPANPITTPFKVITLVE